MRARYPDTSGFVDRGGVKIGYEMFGDGAPALVFAPLDPITHSLAWKAQVPFLAREFRVITIDPRGNGRSGRPQSAEAYADTEYAADTIAVMDACQVDRAVIVGLSTSGWFSLLIAALYPDRVLGVVAIAADVPYLAPLPDARAAYDFDEVLDSEEGWAKENRHYWLRDWRGYVEFFAGEVFCEPHSTKPREDGVAFAMETRAETMLARAGAPLASSSAEETEQLLRRVRCPVLAIHGDQDRCVSVSCSERIAELTGAELLIMEGAAHGRDHGQQLHGVLRPGRQRELRPLGGRRGVGCGLFPAREPRAQASAIRLAHRLRGLSANARRRRRGGGADR
jgi:pimeloyl-ACP methyl ester carboxylesterase